MEPPKVKREFVFISSNDAVPGSASTTDFTVKFTVPYKDVIKVDLIQTTIDYRFANVLGVSFSLGSNTVYPIQVIIEDGLYTPATLAAAIQSSLGPNYAVNVGGNPFGVLSILFKPTGASPPSPAPNLVVSDSNSQSVLGYTRAITPTNVSGGGLLYTFQNAPTLNFTDRYFFVQSTKIGNDIRTPLNSLAYKFMLINDPVEYTLTQVNNRVDTYNQSPRFLQDVDVRLVDHTGAVLNNYGGEFAMLVEIVSLDA